MDTAICTLFEGDYHYGVATLSNSLYKQGYRGIIFVGYRGELPNWASQGVKKSLGKWNDAITMSPIEGLDLIFLSLTTNYSLTNYKPDFMLELWENLAENAEALFYFDPDIVVNDSWTCFEQWVNCGIALCEDIDSPLQEFHPRRVGWRNYYKNYNIDLRFKNSIYVNGGFIGLLKKDLAFLTLWKKLQENMGELIGGLQISIFSGQNYSTVLSKLEGFSIFDKTDQDALNATVEAYPGTVSYLGKEGMGFESKHITMFHSLGNPKPWKAKYFTRAFKGKIPRRNDVEYWKNTKVPLSVHSKREIKFKKISIKIAKLIGRFYRV